MNRDDLIKALERVATDYGCRGDHDGDLISNVLRDLQAALFCLPWEDDK